MKWSPVPDRFVAGEPIYDKGGFYLEQTHSNINRVYNSSSTSYKFSVSAYTKTYNSRINFSVYSLTGSTSGYWMHAMTYMLGYNPLFKIGDYVNYFSSTANPGFKNVVVMNMPRQEYGDRIKAGTFVLTLTSGLSVSSITGSDQLLYGSNPNWYLYPFLDSSNESIILPTSGSLTGNIMGKLFPYNGFGIFLNTGFGSSSDAVNFVNSITSIQWDTDLLTTEIHVFAIKDAFQLNGTTNPSIYQPLNPGTGSLSGYSYGRDGLTGADSQFIATASAISTYASSIGFYNDNDECLIVMKLPQPIKLIKELPYSFRSVVDLAIK